MDEQRALLDSLMGRNRDGDRPEEDISDFRHPRVCKPFLSGLCPHELFQNTKLNLGVCAQLHLPVLQAAFEAQADCAFDAELERELGRFLTDVDRKIGHAQRRLEEQDGAKPLSLLDVEQSAEALQLATEIQDFLQQAEDAGNQGEVDKAMELMQKAEELKQKRADVQANAMIKSVKADATSRGGRGGGGGGASDEPDAGSSSDGATSSSGNKAADDPPHAGANTNQRLRVCDVCGAYLSIYDSDRRLADHFGGKLHIGYLKIRKKMREIAEQRRERRRQQGSASGNGARERDRNPVSDRSGKEQVARRRSDRQARSKSRSRSRPSRRDERGSRRSRDRSHSRGQEAGRDGARSLREGGRSSRHRRHRHRSPSRSRSRSRSQSRSRSRSRGRRRRR